MKLKNSNCDEAFKNSNCDVTQKTLMVTKLKKKKITILKTQMVKKNQKLKSRQLKL